VGIKLLLIRCLKPLENIKNIIFIGFLAHAGNLYKIRSIKELNETIAPQLEKALSLKFFVKDKFPLS